MTDAQRVREAAEQLIIEATHGGGDGERAWAIRRLVDEQTADDRATIGHASGGQTGTFRIGSTWVNSLPGGDTTMDARTPWQNRDPAQDELARAMDTVLSVLTVDEMTLLLLRYDHRAPLREIGDIIGVGKDTVSRMLETLRGRVRASIMMVLDEEPGSYEDVKAMLVETSRTIGEDR